MKDKEVDVVLTELEHYGIKPLIENGGKHLKINWRVNGHERSVTVAKTSSDIRARLNNRALVRRFMRIDNVTPPAKPAVTTLEHALQLPIPTPVLNERVTTLEEELTALLDLFVEQRELFEEQLAKSADAKQASSPQDITLHLDISINGQALVSKPHSPQPAAQPNSSASVPQHQQELVVKPSKRSLPGRAAPMQEKIMAVLEFHQVKLAMQINQMLGHDRSDHRVSAALHRLKEKGLVESLGRGQWRKTPIQFDQEQKQELNS